VVTSILLDRESNVIALVVPTRPERQSVLKALPSAQPEVEWDVPAWRVGGMLIVEAGIGPEKAAALLPGLEAQDVDALWLFGWCGGLAPDLNVGDLVLADATLQAEPPRPATAHPPTEGLQAHVRRVAGDLGQRLLVGPVLTSPRVLFTVADKRAGAETGAIAVEMEAGPLARWAAEHDVPFVHLRVVLDPYNSALPGKRPKDSRLRLLWYYVTHPIQWFRVWSLIRHAPQAMHTMTEVIAALAVAQHFADCPGAELDEEHPGSPPDSKDS
jgi:nucleoside phosphorylase